MEPEVLDRRLRRGARPGRPPKFAEPSRPVTVTLPERTLELLATIDDDRARAIVKAVDVLTGAREDEDGEAEVSLRRTASGESIIVVGSSRCLRHIPWLRLVELEPGRHLLSLPTGTAVEKLELALHEILAEPEELGERELRLLGDLAACLAQLRRSDAVQRAEILLVDGPAT